MLAFVFKAFSLFGSVHCWWGGEAAQNQVVDYVPCHGLERSDYLSGSLDWWLGI